MKEVKEDIMAGLSPPKKTKEQLKYLPKNLIWNADESIIA